MADADTIRRREIRKRKILEHSEARLNRITNAKSYQDTANKTKKEEFNVLTKDILESNRDLQAYQETSENVNSDSFVSTAESFAFNRSKPSVTDDEDSYNISSNGSAQRSSATDNYIFPKKVSDAETRSFVRSRSDARRNSTCTQMMMETFQFTSFSLPLLRPWITAVLSVILKAYFLFAGKFPLFQTLLFPFFLLEVAYFSWMKFELQVNSRQDSSSLISGILLLFGIPLYIVTGINSVFCLVKSAIQDLAVYMFTFVFLHFICETYM